MEISLAQVGCLQRSSVAVEPKVEKNRSADEMKSDLCYTHQAVYLSSKFYTMNFCVMSALPTAEYRSFTPVQVV